MDLDNMRKIAVIYKSVYGTTKRYAEWIAGELNAGLFEASEIKPEQLTSYDVVVFGGGLYAGGIAGVKLVTKNPCKKLVVFTVGLADPANTDYSPILKKNFTKEHLAQIKVFHLQGGMDYAKLNLVHRAMMAALKKAVERTPPEKRGADDLEFLATYGKKLDYTNKSAITPLIEHVRSL
jgi:menaquinone-dependent protoporphyrinogen IX oxidase